MNIAEALDLQKAFRRVDNDRRDDAWMDVVGYRDYKKKLHERLPELRERIGKPRSYRGLTPLCIDLPKRGFTLRPGVVPQLEDRIVYQAIADFLAPHFIPEPNVYSNHLAGEQSSSMFLPGVELWVKFLDQIEANCHKFPYVVETDITAYFDHINHDILLSRINDLFVTTIDTSILDEAKLLLRHLLGIWSEGLRSFNIPQINDASSFFGNVYLDELDKWFFARGIMALRYVDDIRLFASSEPDARKILAELIVKLRKLGLYVASGKTKLRLSTDVLAELVSGRKQMLEIEDHIKSAEPNRLLTAANLLTEFFKQLIADPNSFNDRQFRYCVNRFKRLHVTGIGQEMHEQVIAEVIKRLHSMPESTDVFVDYLSLFAEHEVMHQKVIDFLNQPYNIYAWQESLLMELLLRCNLSKTHKTQVNTLATFVITSGKHPASKSKAYLLRGKYGTYADRKDIRSLYNSEDREDVKRAIVVAIQEMNSGERDNWFKSITHESINIESTVEYVKSLPKPSYFYYNPPNPYEINWPNEDSDDLGELGSEYFV